MKSMKTWSVAAVAALALGVSACDEGLADLNENPNAPRDVPAPNILPAVMQSTVEQAYGQWFNLEFAGLFAQHWSKIQYLEEDNYELRPGTLGSFWEDLYTEDLTDWQTIIQKGQEPQVKCGTSANPAPCVNYEATGLVMKSFTYQIMTDIWGAIPYSQALQGDAEEAVTTPEYDSQQAIYNGMVADIDAALALFDPSAVTWGPEDLIYGGDISLWQRFANSLKLRMAIRISDVDPATAQQWAEEAASHPAGLIMDNSQNASLVFLEAAPNQNPLFENAKSRDDHAVSRTLVQYMGDVGAAADVDPRLSIYAEPAAEPTPDLEPYVTYQGDIYRGQPNGAPEGTVPLPAASRIGDLWRDIGNSASAATPFFLLTAAEVHFLLAESAYNGWNVGGTAQSFYEDGVRLSMEMWDELDPDTEITSAEVTAYLNMAGVQWGSTAEPTVPGGGVVDDADYERIIEQKWLALYTNGPEAYAEYRRTGYPDEVTVRSGHVFPFVPGRVPYPDAEQSLNRENWQAAIDAQDNDGNYTGTVWWDTTPQD